MTLPLRSLLRRVFSSPSRKVSLVSIGMALLAIGLLSAAPGLTNRGTSLLVAAGFVAAYFVSESVVFNLEIRKQAHSFSVTEAIFVIAVFTIDPLVMVLAAPLGAGLAMLIVRRMALVKLAFNLARSSLEATVVALVVTTMSSPEELSLMSGAVAILAVALADLVGATSVFGAIWIFECRPRRRHALDVYRAQIMVTLLGGSVGVVGAAAMNAGGFVVVFLGVVGAGMVSIFRQHATITSRYTGLQTLHDFSRTIANDVDIERVLVTAMTDVVDVIAAGTAAVIVLDHGSFGAPGVLTVVDRRLKLTPFAHEAAAGEWRRLMTDDAMVRPVADLPSLVAASIGVDAGQIVSMRLGLRDDESVVFVATKSSTSVGTFDASTADQVGALVRQLSATLRNGLFVRQLDEASRRDDLTGLANRAEFIAQVEAAPVRAMSIAVIGLQGFDEVNETLGHEAGDTMIRATARELVWAFNDSAFAVARISGGTFGVALRAADSDLAIALVRAALGRFAKGSSAGSLRLDTRCRAGVVVIDHPGQLDAATLVQRGDLALNDAKRSGQQVSVYRSQLDETQRRRVMLIGELREAIAHRDFALWFQPKLELATGSVVGAEALIRWNHRELGPIAPDEFIGVAETAGLVGEITEQVLEMAAVEARRWIDAGRPMMIAVNLSAHDLVDPLLPSRLAALLERHQIGVEHLGLELTETAVVVDGQAIIAVLGELRDMGFTLFVDDYGTGYSSLSYLRMLPVHFLKIDQAFVRNLATNVDDDVIVHSTIDMAHRLGLSVVAEGVEDLAAYERLRELGCEAAQGFFMAQPMTSAGLDQWMADLPKLQLLLGYGEPNAEGTEPSAHERRPRSRVA